MSHQGSLFDKVADATRPLAARMRPEALDEVVGQEHLISKGKILRRMIRSDQVPSVIFWRPPGVGKTTLARVIAHQTRASFIDFSAVTSGIKGIRDIMKRADAASGIGTRTIVFIDKTHRFSKAQQDAFLPFVEKGAITSIGAITENPSFEVNGTLSSHCRVFVLKGPLEDEIMGLLSRALEEPRDFGDQGIRIEDDLLRAIAVFSNGDTRSALSVLEMVALDGDEDDRVITVTGEIVAQYTSQRSLLYDRAGEEHHNIISTLHKSMRNPDPGSAVYWLARMLKSGKDPVYLARRITYFAAEDIGLADTSALVVAINAFHACHFIGMPECTVHLAGTVIYLSMVPKSNSSYTVYEHAKKDALHSMAEPVPLVIRNAPVRLMKDLGYGEGYRLAHSEEGKVAVDMQCPPDSPVGTGYYTPTKEGHENHLRERLARLRALRQGHQ